MNELSLQSMTRLVTAPYRRGAETLVIPIGADAGGQTDVAPYDFKEYKARHQADPPEPKYVIFPKTSIGGDDLDIQITFSFQGAEQTVSVKIPPRTLAGTSFAIPLPEGADATLRLLRFRQSPLPLPGTGEENFGILALLGNIAKLAWVFGWEKDFIRHHLQDIKQQRLRSLAHGFSLDQLGKDLRVPRFPAREHSFDANTVALYHLNDLVADNGAVIDETVRFGAVAHPGTNKGASSGATGKFGNGFRFPGTSGSGAIEIASHADFNITANGSFTVEAFVSTISTEGAGPRVIILKGQLNVAGALTAAGWSLTVGTFRGINNNPRWAASDGVKKVEIFADLNLGDARFHHLAAEIDRARKRARLFVDGEERSNIDITGLVAINNAELVRIGRSATGHQLFGAIDEVRLSNMARPDFHPVVGESDEAYRQRLGIFERWLLPTPDALVKTINGMVQINGQADSFVIIERDRALATAGKVVRLLPASLPAGQHIDLEGDSRSEEVEASGAPEDDIDFRDIYLIRHDKPQVTYGADENNRRMQARTARALDALLALLAAAQPPIAGNLIIDRSFNPADKGLHRAGRALRFRHPNLALSQLGVFAHRAGFDFVRTDPLNIYASVSQGEKLEIAVEQPQPAAGIDVVIGSAIDLHISPESLPPSGLIKWTLIVCGAGRAHFVKHTADAANLTTPLALRPRLGLVADSPGEITLRVEYTSQRRTVTGTKTIRIGIKSLNNQESIAANGDMKIGETDVVGRAIEDLKPMYLITSNAPVNFGADPNNRRMQIVLERPLNRLVTVLGPAAVAGLEIIKAFDPADTGFHKVGRALRMRHSGIDAGGLGGLAHQAGFDFVRREGAQVYCSVAPGERIEIATAGDLRPISDELTVGSTLQLRVRFTSLPPTGSYNWSMERIGQGAGSFDFILRPQVSFTPKQPGLLVLNATYLEQDAQSTFPYTFEIRLKNSLDVPGTIIPKHQYDIIMNILNYFHPIGVEVVTDNIRKRVVEIEQNPLKAFPAYTYPDFRV